MFQHLMLVALALVFAIGTALALTTKNPLD